MKSPRLDHDKRLWIASSLALIVAGVTTSLSVWVAFQLPLQHAMLIAWGVLAAVLGVRVMLIWLGRVVWLHLANFLTLLGGGIFAVLMLRQHLYVFVFVGLGIIIAVGGIFTALTTPPSNR